MNATTCRIACAALALVLAGCSKTTQAPAAPAAEAKAAEAEDAAHAHDEHAGHGEAEEHAGHDHEHGAEGSDLDRPVEELFAATCEHQTKTFECDECRYEVGVARAPRKLFEGGLLETARAETRPVEAPITLNGEIGFDERRIAHLSAQTEGLIRKVHVSLGDTVKTGQPLLELESVGFGEAASEYLEARATLELARRNAERQEQLRKEAITSEREFLEARQGFEAAQIRAQAAGDKLVRLGLSPSELDALGKGERARLVLRAPAAGTVLAMHAVPGEVAKAEEPLMTIGDLSSLWLWADLYERDLAKVAEHQARGKLQASVQVKAFRGEEFPGVVDFLGPTMDSSTRTVKMRIEVKNPAGRLRAGMFATVRIFLPGTETALAIPKSALLEDEGRTFVFVHHHDDYYVRRPVQAGRTWGTWQEVTQGLAGGETLVGNGCFLLKSDVLRSKMGAGCAD